MGLCTDIPFTDCHAIYCRNVINSTFIEQVRQQRALISHPRNTYVVLHITTRAYRGLAGWSFSIFPTEGDVFVLGGCSRAKRRETTVLWPISKKDHLSPELGLATPAVKSMVRQNRTYRVPAGLQNKPPPISFSTHIPSTASQQLTACTPIPMTAALSC